MNKNIATPLNQHDLVSRKNSDGKDQNLLSNGNHAKEELVVRSNKFQNEQHTYQVSRKVLSNMVRKLMGFSPTEAN